MTRYYLQFQVYTGKTNNAQEKGLTYRVITDLWPKHYLNKNQNFFFDNSFTTLALMVDLAAKGTYCCGTIRPDRCQLPWETTKATL